ncbi:MAG: MFS transporter [Rhodobacteraceae bacterium]|nr:MFS transporter [Paracoccaceae bacterium]MCY4141519.1 MFS transporter [Paracoccaceae bacterium]
MNLPERPKKRRVLGTCCSAHAAHDGLSDMLYVILPVLVEQFGLSLAQIGMIRGAHRTAMSLFQIIAALLAERLGERVLLIAGTALTGIFFILAGMSSGFYALLILLFLVGLGQSVQHPLCSSMLGTAYRAGGHRGALGTYNFSGDVGKFIVAGSCSLLLAAGVAWQVPAIGYGVVMVLVAIFLMVVLTRLNAGGVPTALHMAADKGWGIIHRRGFASLCAIAAIDNGTRTGFLTFVVFLMLEKGVPEGWAFQAIPALLIGGIAGKLACGYLAEYFGVIRMVVVTEVATAAGMLLLLVLPNVAAFALLPILGVVLNGTSSVVYGTVGDLVERDRQSRAFGLIYTLGTVFGVFTPLAYGMLGDRIGIEATLAIASLLVLFTLPFAMQLRSSVAIRTTAV